MRYGWRRWVGAGGALVAVLAVSLAAQERPRELFERARLLEENVRTLNRAAAMYEEVVTLAKNDRALAAEAELRLAVLTERQGKPEARSMFARVAREYSDVPDIAATARAKAATGNSRRGGREVLPQRVLEGGYAMLTEISGDGRVAVGMERAAYSSNSIVTRDVESGNERPIVSGGLTGSAAAPRLSADGRQLAYAWFDIDDGFNVVARSLRVMPIDASAGPAVVFQDPGKWVRPSGWSPDGKRILLNVQRVSAANTIANDSTELAWLALGDKSYRVLKTFESWQTHYPERLSPDGRYVAYPGNRFMVDGQPFARSVDRNDSSLELVFPRRGRRSRRRAARDRRQREPDSRQPGHGWQPLRLAVARPERTQRPGPSWGERSRPRRARPARKGWPARRPPRERPREQVQLRRTTAAA